MAKILNKCPLCGGGLEYNALHQYSLVYKVLKSGKMSAKRVRKEDNGPMECGFLACINQECGFVTDCDLRPIDIKLGIDIYTKSEVFMYEKEE